jgi:hypothetical protein
MTVTNVSSAGGDSNVAITGTGSLVILGNVSSTDQLVITVATGASLSLAGDSDGGEPLKFVADGVSTLTLNGSEAQALAGIYNSGTDNTGKMVLSGDGTKTFAEAVGGVQKFGLITNNADATTVYDTTTATVTYTNAGTSTFTGVATITTVNNTGLITFTATPLVDTVNNSGTINLVSEIDNEAGNGDVAIIMTTADSVVNFNASTAKAFDMVVTAATDGFGTLNFIDSAAGAASTNTTAGGDIGTTAARIGTINIGSATNAGNLTTIAGDLIFADQINITGGDLANGTEDSKLTAAASVTSTNGILLTKGIGDAELEITAAATITGVIDGAGTGAGNSLIDVREAVTFASSIGNTGTVDLMTVLNAKTATFTGSTINVASILLAGDSGTMTFSGSTIAQTITGIIEGATAGSGVINLNNTGGIMKFVSAVGQADAPVKAITIADATSVDFNSTVFTETLTINQATAGDFTRVGAKDNLIGTVGGNAGALVFATGTKIQLGSGIVAGDVVFDVQTATAGVGGVVVNGDMTVALPSNFTSGTITLIDGDFDATTAAEVADILAPSTALVDYTVAGDGGATNDVTITANLKSSSAIGAGLGVSAEKALSFTQLLSATTTGGDTALMDAITDGLNATNGGSLATVTTLVEQASPQTDTTSGSVGAAMSATNNVQSIMDNRMASLRSGDAYVTGMSAGDGISAKSGFIQAFGSDIEQKNRTKGTSTNFGYDAQSSGVAIGFDGITDGGSTIGLSGSLSTTDVDGKGLGRSKNSIDSYSVSAYADKVSDNGYVEGSITFGVSENSTSRLINTAGINRAYSAKFDTTQYSLKLGAGAPKEISNGGFVTPFISATATNISSDSYTETSNVVGDNLRIRTSPGDISSLVGTAGVKAHWVTDMGIPMISLAVNNEFGDNQINATNSYTGGGTAFKTASEVEELSATLGLGYTFTNGTTDLNFGYEAQVNDEKYTGQSGTIKLISRF